VVNVEDTTADLFISEIYEKGKQSYFE